MKESKVGSSCLQINKDKILTFYRELFVKWLMRIITINRFNKGDMEIYWNTRNKKNSRMKRKIEIVI